MNDKLKLKILKSEINSTILFLTFNDIFTWGTHYVVTVLVGLYLSEKLQINATEIVGIGAGVLFIARGATQLPTGFIIDRLKTDIDETLGLMIGNVFMGIPIILLTQVTEPIHYYAIQFVFGIGGAINLVCWRKLFAKSLDKGKEGTEYALYETAMSLSIAIFSLFGGIIASVSDYYFDMVMASLGMVMIVSNFWVYFIYQKKRQEMLLGVV